MNPNVLPISLQELDDEDKDMNFITEILQREYYMVHHFHKECHRFFKTHDVLFDEFSKKCGGPQEAMFHLLNKEEEELTTGQKALLDDYHKVHQIIKDGEEMMENHYALEESEPEGEPPVPYWMKRHPKLHQAAYDGLIFLNKNKIKFKDSIFCRRAPEAETKSIIDEKIKEMEGQPIHKILQVSQKEVDKRDARDWEATSVDQKKEEYVKKSRAIGEVLNLISDDVQETFDKRLRIIEMEQAELQEFGNMTIVFIKS